MKGFCRLVDRTAAFVAVGCVYLVLGCGIWLAAMKVAVVVGAQW